MRASRRPAGDLGGEYDVQAGQTRLGAGGRAGLVRRGLSTPVPQADSTPDHRVGQHNVVVEACGKVVGLCGKVVGGCPVAAPWGTQFDQTYPVVEETEPCSH